ncbi:MAG: hypothetical protein JO041_10685 [Acidobacteria bacterium]|nr:hypothetical protein [Acidobacteriota bacterium]
MASVCTLAAGQTTPKVVFEANETLFAVASTLNACGYDDGLNSSVPLRAAIRGEMAAIIDRNPAGTRLRDQACNFYHEHQQGDSSRDVAQFISLALNLGEPPVFSAKSDDMPPDAGPVQEFASFLQSFYQAAGLRELWRKHQAEYAALLAKHHDAITAMIQQTDGYLRMPVNAYVGREYTIYLEPMLSPARVNARIYGDEYFLVLSPGSSGAISLDPMRHMYLHYILDPLAAKRPLAMKRLEPLLGAVTAAPMDDSYKHNISLLVTESLIHAIEARRLLDGKAAEPARQEAVNGAEAEGYILTHYFYEAMANFEKSPVGLRDAFADMLAGINVEGERHRAQQIVFARRTAPDPLHAGITSNAPSVGLLELAERKLSAGDRQGAEQLAQQALTEKKGDEGRALFVLARTSHDIRGSQAYFERALEVTKEPRVVAWSHVYLGRIYDLRYRDAVEAGDDTAAAERQQALAHYRAALASGYGATEMKSAADAGLKQPYEPAAARGNKEDH